MNLLALELLLAEEPVNNGPDFGKASPVGLVIVVLLLIGVLLLGWSMNRQLKKVPASFDDSETVAEEAKETTKEAGTESPAGESNG